MKKPHEPYKPNKPYEPTEMITVEKKIDVSGAFTFGSTLETSIKILIEKAKAYNFTPAQVGIFYEDEYGVYLTYYVEEKNSAYKQQMKFYKEQYKTYEKALETYKLNKIQFDRDKVLWDIHEKKLAAKAKKKLYEDLKKEFGND